MNCKGTSGKVMKTVLFKRRIYGSHPKNFNSTLPCCGTTVEKHLYCMRQNVPTIMNFGAFYAADFLVRFVWPKSLNLKFTSTVNSFKLKPTFVAPKCLTQMSMATEVYNKQSKLQAFRLIGGGEANFLWFLIFSLLAYQIQCVSRIWTSLTWLILLKVVRFQVRANFSNNARAASINDACFKSGQSK